MSKPYLCLKYTRRFETVDNENHDPENPESDPKKLVEVTELTSAFVEWDPRVVKRNDPIPDQYYFELELGAPGVAPTITTVEKSARVRR